MILDIFVKIKCKQLKTDPRRKTTTLILDFDGTIADTVDGIVRTAKASLAEIGEKDVPREEIISLIGLPLDEMFRKMTGKDEEEFISVCTSTYRRLFKILALDSIKPFPAVKETLRTLKDKGISLNIASSRSRPSLFHFLERENMTDLFDIVLGVNEAVNHKPHPEMVLRILSEKGASPDEAIMIGDTTFDIMMGHAAGCTGCGVTYGNHSREMLSEVGTEFIIDSFGDLINII